MKKKVLAMLLSAAMLSGIVACGAANEQTNTVPADTQAEASTTEAEEESEAANATESNYENVLNLAVTTGSIETSLDAVWVNRGDLYKTLMFRSLLIATPDLRGVEPDLAESYSVSDDGMTIEVVMKDNILWHDDVPITAEDVKWSVEAALQGSLLNAIYSNAFSCLKGYQDFKDGNSNEIEGITVDGNKVIFQLDKSSSTFVNILAQFAVLPKHCLENANLLELQNDEFWKKPIGSGMYKLEEFNPGNYVVYTRFDGYEGAKPSIDKLVCTAVGDVIVAAQNGEADYIMSSNPEQITQLDQMAHMTKYPVDINYYRYLVCNLEDENGQKNEKIWDPRIRKALLMAIDRQSILDGLFTGLGTVTDTGLPKSAVEYKPAEEYKYDPEAVKALLEEAGFDFEQTIKLRYYAGDQASANMMEAIAFSWEAIGVKVDVAKFQGSSSEELFQIRDYDFSLKALSAFAYEEYYGEYVSTNSNFSKILGGSTVFDELVQQLGATEEPGMRAEILEKLQSLEQEMLYKMPIGCFGVNVYINSDKIDIGNTVFGNPYYNYQNNYATWTVK